jgi:lambda repressor-like predicted transcriptional regulator
MDTRKKIKAAAAYGGHSLADVARACDLSTQALANRLSGNARFSLDEWQAIAEAIGARFDAVFEFPDGTKI